MNSRFATALTIITILLATGIQYGSAVEVPVNPAQKPGGAVLLIVDGLGSSYFYPEYSPVALDGSALPRASAPNLTFGKRILDIRTPSPVTGPAHSVIVTGNSKAEEEMVGLDGATIFDSLHRQGFLSIAVMEKGDFSNMRNEQDAILSDANNSHIDPQILVECVPKDSVLKDVCGEMNVWKSKFPDYFLKKEKLDVYTAYNRWGIDAADAVLRSMVEKHPGVRFILTINVGGIDGTGHNMGIDDYVKAIEDLDQSVGKLHRTAAENNIAFILTADHGMGFSTQNAQRGGHASNKYEDLPESRRIPLSIDSPNVHAGIMEGRYGQEDIAPTILTILDVPDSLKYKDGEPIGVKDYVSLYLDTGSNCGGSCTVEVWRKDKSERVAISEANDSFFAFTGLNPGNYTIKATSGGNRFEKEVPLFSDKLILFGEEGKKSKMWTGRQLIAIAVIFFTVTIGMIVIRRIMK